MSARTNRRGFATRPADPEQWIKAGPPPQDGDAAANTARLPPATAGPNRPPVLRRAGRILDRGTHSCEARPVFRQDLEPTVQILAEPSWNL